MYASISVLLRLRIDLRPVYAVGLTEEDMNKPQVGTYDTEG